MERGREGGREREGGSDWSDVRKAGRESKWLGGWEGEGVSWTKHATISKAVREMLPEPDCGHLWVFLETTASSLKR